MAIAQAPARSEASIPYQGRHLQEGRQDRPIVGFHQRASVQVIAAAMHLILSGWLPLLQFNAALTECYMPSETHTGWYRQLFDHSKGRMVCDCYAGVICKHLVVCQIARGWCAFWPAIAQAVPGGSKEAAEEAAA